MFKNSTIDRAEAARPVRRRWFLKTSVAGGLAVPFIYFGAANVQAAAVSSCGYKLSAVEALGMFTDLLFRIQSDGFNKLNAQVELIAIDCQQQFRTLCNLVQQLETELSQKNNSVQNIKVLAEIGCANAEQMINSSSTQNAAAMLRSLETINGEIGRAVKELLPEGETVLGPGATRALRAILAEVHKGAASQQQLDYNQEARRKSREFLTQGIQNIQGLLFSASSQILLADEGSAMSLKPRDNAVDLLGQARDKLQSLIDNLKDRQLYSDESPGEFLLAVIDGTKQWVSNPASVGAVRVISQRSKEVRFITVNDVSQPIAPVDFVGFDSDKVSKLLGDHCPPDGWVHLSQVVTAMTAIVGWRVLRTRVGFPPSAATVRAKVWSAMSFLHLSCRPYTDRVPDPVKLADELTKMILS